MGGFIAKVKAMNDLKTSNPLTRQSLSKIREFHGTFKSVCDNFAINLTEFETIFASKESTFAVWDTDNNGMIECGERFRTH